MRALHTALLTGPYDWNPSLVPLAEFETRLATVRQGAAERGADALLVHGIGAEHGALAYVSGFTPKLGPAFALISPAAAPTLLVSGGPNMLPAAQRLTWIQDVRPFRDLAKPVGQWLTTLAAGGELRVGLAGCAAMTARVHKQVAAAVAPLGSMFELELDRWRRQKSAVERVVLRRAAAIVRRAAQAFERAAARGARAAALAAERAAYEAGAQDVRILASARDGGPPLPVDSHAERRVDPLLAQIAIRHAGYWAEADVTVGSSPGAAFEEARAGLTAMIQAAGPGVGGSELAQAARSRHRRCTTHPLAERDPGNSIGLSLVEEPLGADMRLEPGGVYVLRDGAMGAAAEAALLSAMIAVDDDGIDVL